MAKKKRGYSISKIILFIFIGIVLILSTIVIGKTLLKDHREEAYQASLQPFYTPPNPLPGGKPGDIIRKEQMNLKIPNLEAAYRILYLTESTNGKTAVSSGMVFIPKGEAPANGRTVLAWAHGTVGMGDACAPSRSEKPLSDMTWVQDALARGWVVAATDYKGLGTSGTLQYLIGQSEAYDVLNSVRAAQNIENSKAGNAFLLWGHSQGGQSVLFSANLAKFYAPELTLVAAAAGAPAAEITALLSEQYDKPVSWLIGPEISVAWEESYPDLDMDNVISKEGRSSYKRIAQKCILKDEDTLLYRSVLKQKYFANDPAHNASWRSATEEQTARPITSSVPVIIAQGLADTVVLPNTTALYAKKSCDAGTNLTMMWMTGVEHIKTAIIAGPYVMSWLDQRLQGIPAVSNCNQPFPVSPVSE